MKSWTAIAAAAALIACSQPAEAPQQPPAPARVNIGSGQYALDPHHSTVTVRARHFGLSNYVLRFNTVSGSLNFDAEDPARSTVEATVATTSLDTPYGGERDFDAELQNSAWLDSARFPTATFRSTQVEVTGADTARVTGDLTIKGVTRPVTLDVTYNTSHRQHPLGPDISMIGFSARGTVSRSQYGVNELSPSAPGEPDGVGDEVEILIEAEFTRENQASPMPGPAEPVN